MSKAPVLDPVALVASGGEITAPMRLEFDTLGGIALAETTSPATDVERTWIEVPVGMTAVLDTRRPIMRAALAAAGVEEPLTTTYELTQGSPATRAFHALALGAGYTEARRAAWPSEAVLGEHGDVLFRGDDEAVFRIGDAIVYASLGHGWAHVSVAAASADGAHDLVASFQATYPPLFREATDNDSTVPITFWTDGPFGAQSRLRRIEAQDWDAIDGNYTAPVRDELAALASDQFEPGRDGQLLLWQGPPGTGKTWALRALAGAWSSWAEFHYITDPDAFFVTNPSYMVDVLLADTYQEYAAPTDPDGDVELVTSVDDRGKWRVLILEDTGELLSANAKHEHGQGLSRLLNVVDGMVGQGLRVLAIVTTNDELGDLHPAVVRPGRCASQIEFGALTAEEAAVWLSEESGGDALVETSGPMTLAELYAATRAEPVTVTASTAGDHVQGARLESFATEGLYDDPTMPSETLPEAHPHPDAPELPTPMSGALRWTATLCPEGRATEDGRIFAPGSITHRDLPLSLAAMTVTAEGHDGAEVCGRIDAIWREDASGLIRASGEFDPGEYGVKIAGMVEDRTLRGVSVDIAIVSMEIGYRDEVVDADGFWIEPTEPAETEEDTAPSLDDLLFGGDERAVIFIVREGVIGMATVCPFPAFADATIEAEASLVASVQAPMVWTVTSQAGWTTVVVPGREAPDAVLTASAAGLAPNAPPADWFRDPELGELTGWTVEDDGRVYGHAAPWDTCHVGIPGVCTTAPESPSGYAYFHLKEVVCDDGSRVQCGTITLDTGHAERTLGRADAAAHYDDTGTAVADVVVGEDEHGIWVAGALRADVDAETARKVRGATLSGDWRSMNDGLELIGLLGVNVPGFPVPRTRVLVASGDDGLRVVTLVAAGVHVPDGEGHRQVVGIAPRGLTAAQAASFAALRDQEDGHYDQLAVIARDA